MLALTCHNVTATCSSPSTLYPDDRLTGRDRSGKRETERKHRYCYYTGIKSHPSCYTISSERLLGSDVHEACEEKREKARGRGWIDSGAAISMRYYAVAVLYNVVEETRLSPDDDVAVVIAVVLDVVAT